MIGPGMTREAIEAAQRQVRESPEVKQRNARMEARMAKSAEDVARALAALEAGWEAGDREARRTLRDLYPRHPLVEAGQAAAVLTHLAHTAREPGED